MIKTNNNNKRKIILLGIGLLLLFAIIFYCPITAYGDVVTTEPTPTPPPEPDAGFWENISNTIDSVKDFFRYLPERVALFVLWVVDYIFSLINILAGIKTVGVGGKTLIEEIFQIESVKAITILIIQVCVVLLFVISAFSILKRIVSDKDGPLSESVKNSFKAIALLVAVPMLCTTGVVIMNLLFAGINDAVSSLNTVPNIEELSMGGQIFKIGIDPTWFDNRGGNSVNSAAYAKFFSGEPSVLELGPYSVEKLRETTTLTHEIMSGLVALVVGLAVLWFVWPVILDLCMRLFYLVILLIAAPFPTVMMPMDNGVRFDKWKNEYIQTTISAYAVIFGYSLVMMLYQPIGQGLGGSKYVTALLLVAGVFAMQLLPDKVNEILGVSGGGSVGASAKASVKSGGRAAAIGAVMLGRAGSRRLAGTKQTMGKIKDTIGGMKERKVEKMERRNDRMHNSEDRLQKKLDKSYDKSASKGGETKTAYRGNAGGLEGGSGVMRQAERKGNSSKENAGYIPLSNKLTEQQGYKKKERKAYGVKSTMPLKTNTQMPRENSVIQQPKRKAIEFTPKQQKIQRKIETKQSARTASDIKIAKIRKELAVRKEAQEKKAMQRNRNRYAPTTVEATNKTVVVRGGGKK